MSQRSLYKFSAIRPNSFKKVTTKVESKFKLLLAKSFFKKRAHLLINNPTAVITPNLVGQRVMVYNGIIFSGFLLKRSMVGLPFQQLIRTKKLGHLIHIDKKSKKKKLKQK
jgi:ribosomal protein S19